MRPLAKSGLDLAVEGLDLGLGAGGANPVCGRLYPDGSWSLAFRAAFAVRRPSIPARFSVKSLGPKPLVVREPRPCRVVRSGPKTAPGGRVREPDRFALIPGSLRFSAPPCPSAR